LKKTFILILVLSVAGRLYSQDTLPNFTIFARGNKVVISWVNPYSSTVQLNVQRSYDSLKNFSTIYSSTSPALPQNGYTDVKMPSTNVFYRLFYVFQGGAYFFSKSKRANLNGGFTASGVAPEGSISRDFTNGIFNTVIAGDKRIVTVQVGDEFYRRLSTNSFRAFRDSILRATKDTIYAINDTLVRVNPYVVREEFRLSQYIYTDRDGYINIIVPNISQKKYHVKFFEENGSHLFDINNVKESPLILDKANFIHSGWFLFELYEDNKLKEKNRFFLPKEF